ncbi:hypothetical protein CALCODRAFT_427763, partial [Calocera cornea HHB12733]
KYPLACLSKIMDVYGTDLGVGYDIGCDHSKTVARSSLGTRASAERLRFYVGAFHGYAHNRRCQLSYHPRLLTTAGLEDFETNEWIFSKQNLTAHLYRHASEYHRHATLHAFWARWDEDRHAGLGDWLASNYKQALAILDEEGLALARLQRELDLADQCFPRFLDEERAYFERVRDEPEQDTLAFKYLDTLKCLAESRYVPLMSHVTCSHSGSQAQAGAARL